MRKRFIFLLLLLLFATSVSCAFNRNKAFHADYPYYEDIEQLTNAADLIIIGEAVSAKKVEQLKVFLNSDETLPFTLCEVKITEVIKGTAKAGEVITVKQYGDYKKNPDSALNKLDGYVKADTTNLMFLSVYENSPASPLNPYQGIVSVEKGHLYSNSEYSLFGFSSHERVEDAVDSIRIAIEQQKIGK